MEGAISLPRCRTFHCSRSPPQHAAKVVFSIALCPRRAGVLDTHHACCSVRRGFRCFASSNEGFVDSSTGTPVGGLNPNIDDEGTTETSWTESPCKVVATVNSGLRDSSTEQHQGDHDKIFGVLGQEIYRESGDKKTGLKVKELWYQQQWDEALTALDYQLQQGGCVPVDVFFCLLQECGDMNALAEGYEVHSYIIGSVDEYNVFLNNTLVDMYSKCGSLMDACVVFNNMFRRNVFSWTAIILAHVNQGQAESAVFLFEEMLGTGVEPDKVLFVIVLKACMSLVAPEKGWEVHAYILEYGFESDSHVGSTLIAMHAEFGSLDYAHIAFDKIREPSVVAWNSLIMGYTQLGLGKEALTLYRRMQGVADLDEITFLAALKACISLEDSNEGMEVHAHAIESGLELDLFVGSSLVDMYAKCGSIEHACAFFNKMEERNVVSWTAMIAGYAQQGVWDGALVLFKQMQSESVTQPNEMTYASVLSACSGLASVGKGREIHTDIVRSGLESDVVIGSTLVDMYAKCGYVEDALDIFDKLQTRNVVTWNSMLAGYAQQGLGEQTLELFEKMQKEGVRPVDVTYVIVLKACTFMEALEHGKRLHGEILESGIELDVFVASSLVVMYAKCGSMEDSREIFDNMCQRDVVSWNTVISGYALQGPCEVALDFFDKMQQDGFEPDEITYVGVFKSCGSLAALGQGRHVYSHMMKIGFEPNLLIESTLVDMFSKCGNLEDAKYVFKSMCEHDVVSWTAMIMAYAQQGLGKEALLLYERMKHEGVQPNEVTFVGVFNACSHAGLVHEGFQYFHSMRHVYGITPTVNHYACLIDLLGRAGHLAEAMDLINQMPIDPNEVIWLALLGACRSSNNVELARHAVERVLELNPENASAIVLLSNISAVQKMDAIV